MITKPESAALMKLHYDPYQVFRFSKTPAGLYARQKWLGQTGTPQWKKDFQEAVTALLADQSPDGSWHHETVTTIKRLFGLHLTVRTSTAQIDAALNWLLKKIDLKTEEIHVNAEDNDLAFHQTLNALAHLDLPQAETQLERAFERLFETQNSDGTWSRSDPEWNTFLAIHALRNKGLL